MLLHQMLPYPESPLLHARNLRNFHMVHLDPPLFLDLHQHLLDRVFVSLDFHLYRTIIEIADPTRHIVLFCKTGYCKAKTNALYAAVCNNVFSNHNAYLQSDTVPDYSFP